MVAPRGVRQAWFTTRTVRLLVVSVAVIAVSFALDGTDRIVALVIGVLGVLCCIAVVLLWRREKL